MNKISQFLLLSCLCLFSLTACLTPGRGAQVFDGTANKVIAFELWTDHQVYEFGESVNVRVKLTNVSDQAVTLQSRSGVDPVVDIVIQRGPDQNPTEQWILSQENPNNVLYALTLAPGESYEVEQIQVLSVSGTYSVRAKWLDNFGYQRISSLPILYDVPSYM